MRNLFFLLIVLILSGCGVTRTSVTSLDGTECHSSTYTFGKDVSGGKFEGCNSRWGVESSDPNAALTSNLVQTINLLMPYALKAATAAP